MKRRKSIEAFACVGSHGTPFYQMLGQVKERQGQVEIYMTYEDARRQAISPSHVRRVKIYIEQEPAIS